MGYYTHYKLSLDCPRSVDNEIYYYMKERCDNYYGVLGEDSCKWYDHEAEMRRLSAVFKNVLFRLDGEGEEQGDVWVKYFKNGKMQECRAEVILDDTFDENKLR